MLDLVVVAGSQTVEAKGVVPETPVITVPGAASTVDASQALTVGWTSATDPDRFEVTLTWPGNSGIRFVAVGSDRSLDIPAATMPVGTSVSLDVFAYTNGDDQVTGDATADSAMNIRAETTVAFDTAP
jgi:hypothetical protein